MGNSPREVYNAANICIFALHVNLFFSYLSSMELNGFQAPSKLSKKNVNSVPFN